MKVIKEICLNDKEAALVKCAIILKGYSQRGWVKHCHPNADKVSNGNLGNMLKGLPFGEHMYDRYLKELNLPIFKNFKWEENCDSIKQIGLVDLWKDI